VNFPSHGEHLLETASGRGQFRRGFLREAMKIWQFAVLVLISACVIWLGAWFYEGVSHEAEFVVKHQQM
jgi:hypothetical protein